MARRRHLLVALADPGFRRLFATRIASQFGDGVFQASLAGAVLFDPERQARASDVAAAFAVLLLPYSLIGPFAGVLLDRWWRQRVLVLANIARAIGVLGVAAEIASGLAGPALYASALVIISVSRFLLAALAAATPRVVPAPELVTANALSATGGTLATALGGGAAIGVRALVGDSNRDYAAIAVAALVPFLVAAVIALGFARQALGPSAAERQARETAGEVLRGLQAGIRDVLATKPVANGLAAIGVHRLCYGMWTVWTLLLYRNYFPDDGFFRNGLAGLSQVIAAVAVGGALAAVVTPSAFRRFGPVHWGSAMLATSAVVMLVLTLPYRMPLIVLSGLLLAFGAQAFKISLDTLVQQNIADTFRGRVFALYDTVFNLALVVAAVLTAAIVPEDGHSPATVVGVSAALAVTSVVYLARSRRTTPAAR